MPQTDIGFLALDELQRVTSYFLCFLKQTQLLLQHLHLASILLKLFNLCFALLFMAIPLQTAQAGEASSNFEAPRSEINDEAFHVYIKLMQKQPKQIKKMLAPFPGLKEIDSNRMGATLFARAKGAYDPERNLVLVFRSEHSAIETLSPLNHTQEREQAPELERTVYHEWGHALALRRIAPQKLCLWAKQKTPWKSVQLNCETVSSHYDAMFFKPHDLHSAPAFLIEASNSIPSRYALAGIHEYFSEVFANWLDETQKRKPSRSAFATQLEGLLSPGETSVFSAE